MHFFSEKKKRKTLMPTRIESDSPPKQPSAKEAVLFWKKEPKNFCSLQYAPVVSSAPTNGAKVFWFFFSKKNCFLAAPICQSLRGSALRVRRGHFFRQHPAYRGERQVPRAEYAARQEMAGQTQSVRPLGAVAGQVAQQKRGQWQQFFLP